MRSLSYNSSSPAPLKDITTWYSGDEDQAGELSYLTAAQLLSCLLTSLFILALLSCEGEATTDLNKQSTTAETPFAATQTGELAGESSTAKSSKSRGEYQSVTTILIVPNTLSKASHTQDRKAFHQALTDYKSALKNATLGNGAHSQAPTNKMYCFDQSKVIYPDDLVSDRHHCEFLNSHLTPQLQDTNYKHRMSSASDRSSQFFIRGYHSTRFYYNYQSIVETYHLRAVLDTLEYYDNYQPNQGDRIFKTPDENSTLKVLLQLAYDADTDMSEPVIMGRLIDYYGQDQLDSFMFFALTDQSRKNYQAIAKKLQGQTYQVLDTTPSDQDSHVSMAMTKIAGLVAAQVKSSR